MGDLTLFVCKAELVEAKFLREERRVELRRCGEAVALWAIHGPRTVGFLHLAKCRAQVQDLSRGHVLDGRAVLGVVAVAVVHAVEQIHRERGVQGWVARSKERDLHRVAKHQCQCRVGVLVVLLKGSVTLQDGDVLRPILVGDDDLEECLAPPKGVGRRHLDLHVAFRRRCITTREFHGVKPEFQGSVTNGVHLKIGDADRRGAHHERALALATARVCHGQLVRPSRQEHLVGALARQHGPAAAVPVFSPVVDDELFALVRDHIDFCGITWANRHRRAGQSRQIEGRLKNVERLVDHTTACRLTRHHKRASKGNVGRVLIPKVRGQVP